MKTCQCSSTLVRRSKPDAPVIHDKRPGNLVGRFDFGWGDVEQGVAESTISSKTPMCSKASSTILWKTWGLHCQIADDTLELTPIQHPFRSRDEIAEMFGFDRNKVHIRFPYVGGGFGSKELKTEHLIAIFLVFRTCRHPGPSAEESFRSDCRHAVVYHIKTGVKADGTLVAQDIDLIFDKGAYAHGNGMNVPRRGSSLAWGLPGAPSAGRRALRFATRSPLAPFAVSGEREQPGVTSPTTTASPASWASTRWRFA